jgi:acyl carrier protein
MWRRIVAVTISSRTPDGVPNQCPICAVSICIQPSQPPGDAPCPNCGALLWFFPTSAGMRFHESQGVAPVRDRLLQIVGENLGVNKDRIDPAASFIDDMRADSLDVVELVMELEEEFQITIPDDQAEKIKTVGDAIDFIARQERGRGVED